MLLKPCVTLLLLAILVGAPQQSSDNQGSTIEGVVINSVTGEAISGALVRDATNGGRVTRTDADGRFQFADVPAGTISTFHIKKPGYFDADENFAVPAPGATGLSSTSTNTVTVKLVPEGIIYGRITGEDGEPQEEMQVQILAQHIENGRRTRTAVSGATTDDEGNFRVPQMRPGKYFVVIGPANGEGFFEGPSAPSAAKGYATEFYPGVTEISLATAIEITAGRHVEVSLRLAHQQLFSVSGIVTGLPQGAPAMLLALGSQEQNLGQFPVDPLSGRFDAVGLPGGSCSLIAVSLIKEDSPTIGVARLHLTADVTGLRIALLPPGEIRAHVRKETTHGESAQGESSGGQVDANDVRVIDSESEIGGGTDSTGSPVVQNRPTVPQAFINFVPADEQPLPGQFNAEPVDGDGSELVVKAMVPGVYLVRIGANGPYYVESARSGSVNLLNEVLTIAPGSTPPPLDIVLRDDGANLTVAPQRSGIHVASTVLLIPDGAQNLTQTQTTDASGLVHFGLLAPGHYRLLALEAGSEPEYESADFQRKFAGQWQDVTLAPNQSATVNVELSKAVE